MNKNANTNSLSIDRDKEQMMNTKLQVLVIDDDAVVGRSFDRVLTEKGYQVSTALNGEQALQTMENNDFDVVFTDIKMPGMDGLEVTERIKARCPWTPVVVITGYGTQANEVRASVLGANGFVRKPLTPEMIESVTLKALQDRDHSKERAAAPVETPEKAAEATVAKAEKAKAAPKSAGRALKDVGLFFASPFIALGYVIALPFVGFYMFAKLGLEAYSKKQTTK
jgi:DNA-binding NtrC family response regulator